MYPNYQVCTKLFASTIVTRVIIVYTNLKSVIFANSLLEPPRVQFIFNKQMHIHTLFYREFSI